MDEWIKVAEFDQMSDAVKNEESRIRDMALDVGLIPEKVIRTVDKEKVEIQVHPEFYNYFQG